MAKTLKSLARLQAAQEEQEEVKPGNSTQEAPAETTETTETETTEEAETETEETTEEGETEEGESETTDTTETETAPTPAASLAGALPPGFIGVNAAELKVLQEKAGKWDASEKELTTLQAWYANTIQIGGSAKEDVSNQREKKGASAIQAQPWNKAAIDIAESL